MSLDDDALEHVSDHCEICGTKLTDEELRTALESGGPALCTVHAAEAEPGMAAQEEQDTHEQ